MSEAVASTNTCSMGACAAADTVMQDTHTPITNFFQACSKTCTTQFTENTTAARGIGLRCSIECVEWAFVRQ